MQEVSLIMLMQVPCREFTLLHLGDYTVPMPLDRIALREQAVALILSTEDQCRGLDRDDLVVLQCTPTTRFKVL